MRWYLQSSTYSLFLISSTILLAHGTLSYAQTSNSSVLSKQQTQELQAKVLSPGEIDTGLVFLELPENEIAQANNPTDNNNEKRFIQPRLDPNSVRPESPEINQSEIETEKKPESDNSQQQTSESQCIQASTETEIKPEDIEQQLSETQCFQVTKIQIQQVRSENNNFQEIEDSKVVQKEEFNSFTQGLEGNLVSLQRLHQLADDITQIYLEKGYITSRAFVPKQTVANGVVKIYILEGSIEEIQVESVKNGVQNAQKSEPNSDSDSQKLEDKRKCTNLRQSVCNYVTSRMKRAITTPLSAIALEDQLRLLNTDPLFSKVEASIRRLKNSDPGKNILVVRVTEANQLQAGFSIDNYSPPSVGSDRFGVNLTYRNLTGLGDELAASYYFTTQEFLQVKGEEMSMI